MTPSLVAANSSKKVWWRCHNGHEWQASIGNRNRGHGCIYCSNQKVLPGYNDLATSRPDIAKEWHPTKNYPLLPSEVTCGSEKKVWWKCDKGHEWIASVKSRSKGTGCPYCANRKVLTGYNDLASINPRLAKEWHPTKNLPLTPQMVCANSNIKLWWLCENGHTWEAKIDNRNKGTKCPLCAKNPHKKLN